jgi:peptide chain release factor
MQGLDVTVYSSVKAPLKGTYYSSTLILKGMNLDVFLNDWKGSILWIEQSPYRKFHQRKNWFVGLEAFAFPKQFSFKECDVVFDTMRGSGPGGQHVNKVETAVRGNHVPTGIQVVVTEGRSQLQNKKRCLERLRQRVENSSLDEVLSLQQSQWMEHHQLQRGNPTRIFKEPLY